MDRKIERQKDRAAKESEARVPTPPERSQLEELKVSIPTFCGAYVDRDWMAGQKCRYAALFVAMLREACLSSLILQCPCQTCLQAVQLRKILLLLTGQGESSSQAV